MNSAHINNPDVHELIRLKCNDFLATNLANFGGSLSKKVGNRSTLGSRKSSKENVRSDYEIVDEMSRLKIHSGIPVKNHSATDQIKSLDTQECGKKTPIIKIKLDRKRLNQSLTFDIGQQEEFRKNQT